MNRAISPGVVPPTRGLDKEEPELSQEEDIPSDGDDTENSNDIRSGEARAPRDVEPE